MQSSTSGTYGGSSFAARASAPTTSTLSSLLAKANALNEADHDPELPQIRFGMDEIERMSEVVAGRGKRAKTSAVDGHVLLSNLGVNTSHLTHEIAQLSQQLPAASEGSRPSRRRKHLAPLGDLGPAYAVGDADVGAWGRNWQETVILSGIEAQRQKTVKAFQNQFQARIIASWESDKARVLQEELGVTDDELARLTSGANGASSSSSSASRLGMSSLGASALGASRLGTSVRRFPLAQSTLSKTSVESREGGLVMHNKRIKYEKVVNSLNLHRMRKEPFEVCRAFEATVKDIRDDQKLSMLPSAFEILSCMTQEPSSRNDLTPGAAIAQRQYASAYLSAPGSNASSLLNGRLTDGARNYLEQDFERYIDSTIARNPKEAALGGVPGIANKVRAYVDVTLRTREAIELFKVETVGGIKLWAHVYYLVRAGYPAEALSLVESHQGSVKKDDWSFPGCFKAWLSSPDRRLPKAQRDQLYNDFNAHVRNSANVDQFKYALYKLVGRFEIGRKAVKAAVTTEDWIWYQLALTRENKDGDAPQDKFDLADLAQTIFKHGADKFDANGTRPLAWFRLLLLTAQFERAIAYLYSKPALKTDAVHFAVALQYYGLLRVPAKSSEAEILTIEKELPYLNVARMIQIYITPFHKVEPQMALQYAYLISLASDAPAPTGEAQQQLALDLVRDIVVGSRSWSKLLGAVRADGTKEPGLVQRDLQLLNLKNEDEYMGSVVVAAADQAAADDALVDSIQLYDLASAYDKVVEIVNRGLGHSLGQGGSSALNPAATSNVGLSGAFGGAADIEELASRVHSLYAHDFAKRSRISQRGWETLETLLKLKHALTQFAANRPDLALDTFRSTGLLPLDNDTASIARYAQNFRTMLDLPVVSNLDDVIVTTMKCLHLLSQKLKDSPYGDHGRMAQLQEYKHQAQCLIQFASTLRLRLGPDVYRQLSSMSAFF